MTVVNVTQARNDLYQVVDEALTEGKVIITSKKGNVVLVSEDEWNEVMETMYVLSDPDTLPAVEEARKTKTADLETVDRKHIL